MNLFDVIIVGSGPTGTTAGYILARKGLKVLIIDQKNFPRRKICGGGLTLHTKKLIPFEIAEVIHQEVTAGQIGFRGRAIETILDENTIAFTIDRLTFDSFLLDKAIDAGARTHLGHRVHSLGWDNDLVNVHTNQETFSGRYLIGADGVHSTIAKQTGMIDHRSTSLAYEARLTREDKAGSSQADMITFDFGTILGGYGWIFPKRDHLNVGVCRTWPGRKASKKHLLRYIDQHPGLKRDRIIDIRAFPVPLGGKEYTLHKNNILLAGDAANLADPWLGEGLNYALFSGELAAETIIKHINGEIPDLAEYTQRINTTCVKEFSYAKRFSLLVNTLPYINVRLLKSSRTLQRIMIDLLRGDRTYQEAWQSLFTLAPNRIWKKLRGG